MRDEKLLAVDAVADRFDLPETTIKKWIKQGRIQIVRLGTHIRIPESEVGRIIAAGRVPARSETVAPKDLNERGG
jgi:excisionase family DNA binding protein